MDYFYSELNFKRKKRNKSKIQAFKTWTSFKFYCIIFLDLIKRYRIESESPNKFTIKYFSLYREHS